MAARRSSGYPVHTWSGDESVWPEAALSQGPVRISGSVLDRGASWHVARDRLGGTTVVLIGRAAPPAPPSPPRDRPAHRRRRPRRDDERRSLARSGLG